jgi:hypothetical protein
LPNIGPPDNPLTGGRLEILLYPTVFAFVLLHVPLLGNPGLLAPVGFATTLPEHLEFLDDLAFDMNEATTDMTEEDGQ